MSNQPTPLLQLIEQACSLLSHEKTSFALAGGIIADIYRKEPRATEDVDIVVAIGEEDVELGKQVITSLGFHPTVATESTLQGDMRFRSNSKKSMPQILVGRSPEEPYGVDLLLLTLPWSNSALERAQSNCLDFGFGPVPCLTVEDMIVSKLYAIKHNSSRRYKKSDIPDIALMLEHNTDIDVNYLSNAMINLQLVIPKGIENEAHYILSRISRKNRKKDRSLDF